MVIKSYDTFAWKLPNLTHLLPFMKDMHTCSRCIVALLIVVNTLYWKWVNSYHYWTITEFMYWPWDNKTALVHVATHLIHIKITGTWRYTIFSWYKMYTFDLITHKVHIAAILNLFKTVTSKGGIFFLKLIIKFILRPSLSYDWFFNTWVFNWFNQNGALLLSLINITNQLK